MADATVDPYLSIPSPAPPPYTPAQPPPVAASPQAGTSPATPALDETMARLRANQVGAVPVIDVGTPTPNAQPGQFGSESRPVQVGPTAQAGRAAPAAAVPVQPAPPPSQAATGGTAIVPSAQPATPTAQTASQPSGQTGVQFLSSGSSGPVGAPGPAAPAPGAPIADPYASLPSTAPPPPPDAYAGLPNPPPEARTAPPGPAIPPAFQNQSVQSRPWYKDMADDVAGAMGSLTHGMSLGLDEILDPLVPAIMDSLQTGKSFTDAYDDQVARTRAMRENFEGRYPGTGTALELAGQLGPSAMMSPLFKVPGAGASAVENATAMARNVAASSAVGGASGFTMTPGNVQQRVQGAEQGAAVGAVAEPAAALTTGTIGALRRVVNPGGQIPRVVGQTVRENFGGAVPTVQPAPVPSIPLTLPEATGSPEAASALDTLNNLQVAESKRQQSGQNQAGLNVLMGRAAGEPALHAGQPGTDTPTDIASRGSALATRGAQSAGKIVASEEHRLWNKPSLTEPNVSSITAKDYVARAVRTMRREEPGLELAIDDSPALKRTIEQLNRMPEKAAANQLNAISSRFRRIARSPGEAADVKLVASRLADAVQDGMANAPEVAGRTPASQAELDAAQETVNTQTTRARRQLAEHPLEKPPPRPETLSDFLHSKGGLAPHGDLKAMDLHKLTVARRVGGRTVPLPLVRKNGLSLDYAREAAIDAGFLPQGADINDLLEALRDETSGNPRIREADQGAADYWRHADEMANRQANLHEQATDDVNETASHMGVKLTPVQAEHAVHLRANDPNMTAQEAIEHAVRSDEETVLQQNADRLAFSPPGMQGSAYQAPLPDMRTLREGVKPNPQLVRDLNAARAFTKREAQVLGNASFDNIVRRNSRGNETVVPGTAMQRFFDFTNGVERPGAIANVSKFLSDIRSEWSKLSMEERGNTFDPRDIDMAKHELEQGARNYLFGKMMDAITNVTPDLTGARSLQWRQAVDWLDTNRQMLQDTGLFTGDQLDLLDRFRATANAVSLGKTMARTEGSATFARAVNPIRFVDALLGPISGRLLTMAGAAAIGAFTTHVLGEVAIGAMIASEMSGAPRQALMSIIYRIPRAKLLEKLGEAYRNPAIAHDLAQRLDNPKPSTFSPETREWLRSLLASAVPGQAARTLTPEQPANAQQPAMAQ